MWRVPFGAFFVRAKSKARDGEDAWKASIAPSPFILKGKWVSPKREISSAETWSVSAMCIPMKAVSVPQRRGQHLRLVAQSAMPAGFATEPDHA